MSTKTKQLLEDLSDLEQVIEETAYNAVFSGLNAAFKDLGLGERGTAEPEHKTRRPEDTGGTMKVRARGRKGRTSLPSLTKTQKQVMRSIQKLIDEQGQSPTYTELADDLGKSGVATIVHAIESKGWIRLDNSKYSRKIEVLHPVQ